MQMCVPISGFCTVVVCAAEETGRRLHEVTCKQSVNHNSSLFVTLQLSLQGHGKATRWGGGGARNAGTTVSTVIFRHDSLWQIWVIPLVYWVSVIVNVF